ncbi:MAG: hypothetical protein ACK5KT_11625 [Dysgonomonas sp.]
MELHILDWDEVEDIEDLLSEIEKTFGVKFEANELAHVKTFDEFINEIINKLPYENSDSCTSLQAFYKLRRKIAALGIYDVKNLRPDTKLSEIFPHKRKSATYLEKVIGVNLAVELNDRGPSKIAINALNALFIVSFFELLETKLWIVGIGIPLAIIGYYIALRCAKEYPIHTVRDLVTRIVTYNYMSCRRDKNTINRKELKNIFEEIFSKGLGIEKEELSIVRFE